MTQSISIISIIFLIGAAHGSFLAVALFTNKNGPKRANRYLGCYVILFVLTLIHYYLDFSGLTHQYVFAHILLWPKEFLFGVLIYFYTRELTQPDEYLLKGRQWWHLTPAILHLVVTWPLLFVSKDTQLAVLLDAEPNTTLQVGWQLLLGDIELILTVMQLTVYLLLSLRLLQVHRHRVLASYANTENINLNWLRYLLAGSLAVYWCWIADEFVEINPSMDRLLDIILGLSMVLLIYGMSILGLRQPQVFSAPTGKPSDITSCLSPDDSDLPSIHDVKQREEEEQQKYRYSSLTAEMCASLMTELVSYMKTSKPYRDSRLSLPKLAAEIGISSNYLSQVINQQTNQNFFDFVNRYRIEEVQQLIQKGIDTTILDIALECGFNSKSAFYNAFKKHTGLTPSQYKNSL